MVHPAPLQGDFGAPPSRIWLAVDLVLPWRGGNQCQAGHVDARQEANETHQRSTEREGDGAPDFGRRRGCVSRYLSTYRPIDAFIIDKIQRERELHEDGRESLRIDVPRDPKEKNREGDDSEQRERGVTIVDFNI